jgi:hypothetical protein
MNKVGGVARLQALDTQLYSLQVPRDRDHILLYFRLLHTVIKLYVAYNSETESFRIRRHKPEQ